MQQKWYKAKCLPVLGLCLFLMIVVNVYPTTRDNPSGLVFAAPKILEISNNGDCAACHGGDRVLPDGHNETKGMLGKTCKTCHNRKEQNLQGKVPLSHFHFWNGTSCRGCHGNDEPRKALSNLDPLSAKIKTICRTIRFVPFPACPQVEGHKNQRNPVNPV